MLIYKNIKYKNKGTYINIEVILFNVKYKFHGIKKIIFCSE